MERYNLPTGGIEVIIEGRSSSKLDTVNAVTHSKPKKPTLSIPPDNLTKAGSAKPVNPVRKAYTPHIPAQKPKAKPIRYLVSRSLILVGTLALIGNIPVHSKINLQTQDDTIALTAAVEEALNQATIANSDVVELQLPDENETEVFAGHEVETLPTVTKGRWNLYQVESGDTVESIFAALKLKQTLDKLIADQDIAKVLNDIKPSAKFLAQTVDGKLQQLIYTTGKKDSYFITYHNEQYTGQWQSGLLEARRSQIHFTISKPFHTEAKIAGLTSSLSRQITKIFKKDVNFRRLAIGDEVRVIFEDYIYQGERIASDNVLAAEFDHRGTLYQRVRFSASDTTRYLRPDADLELKQVAFNRYPLKSGRISSGFGMRRHPVFGSRRLHSGTDFAAPRGTPIYATGNGKVRFIGRKGGYGKTIELRHMDGITTLYGHMSRYKAGLNPGDKVKRGDIIGYVGSTGTSTGNHVHYEFRIAGKPHNPMKVALPTTGILSPKEMRQFRQQAKKLKNELEALRETAKNNPHRLSSRQNQFGG